MAEAVETKPKLKRAFKRKKTLQQDLEHVTQEMYVKNLELATTNRTLSLLRTIDNLVLGSQESLQALCQQIAMAIVNNSDYVFVAVFTKATHKEELDLLGLAAPGNFVLPGESPLHGAFLEIPSKDQKDKMLKEDQEPVLIDITSVTDKALAHYLHAGEKEVGKLRQKLAPKSVYLVKLMARQKLVGLMAVGFPSQLKQLKHDDEVLLERLGEAVGVAVDNRLLYEENQRVVRQLQHSNEKLKELDQTKDDFISMASHQLRTPLTSVKGYVSMVVEGDAGKISSPQKKLLDQAFASSQRMVYLIADLLNVSRLRTGKFVIEPVPTNLADVIEGEIGQLTETAKSRNLTLTYHKPKKFPILMFDETKIRQVAMNFMDNAIYYTPSGGHIDVNLVDKGDSIEFTVVDDGIGVPKAEQHHLFSKFYRAGNAKKARPDGTGLGLFMAKKVIIAQNGALIFKSEEGKGSTFGFSFAKSKLKPPKITSNLHAKGVATSVNEVATNTKADIAAPDDKGTEQATVDPTMASPEKPAEKSSEQAPEPAKPEAKKTTPTKAATKK